MHIKSTRLNFFCCLLIIIIIIFVAIFCGSLCFYFVVFFYTFAIALFVVEVKYAYRIASIWCYGLCSNTHMSTFFVFVFWMKPIFHNIITIYMCRHYTTLYTDHAHTDFLYNNKRNSLWKTPPILLLFSSPSIIIIMNFDFSYSSCVSILPFLFHF